MKCPDCKIPMERVDTTIDEHCEPISVQDPYWKCPKCKIEVEDV